MKILICLLFTILLSVSSYSQTDSIKTFRVPNFYLTVKENNKLVKYEFSSDTNNIKLFNDSLYINSSNYKFSVSINYIYGIRFPSRGGFESGVLLGAGIGFGLGFIVGGIGIRLEGSEPFNFLHGLLSGLALMIPVGLITGAISAVLPHTEEVMVDFKNKSVDKNKLLYIFRKKTFR